MAPNITKWRQLDIMHLLIEEYNTIYETVLWKIEPECYQGSRCNSQKTQETDKSMRIQWSTSRWEKNVVVDGVVLFRVCCVYYVLCVWNKDNI